MRQELFTRLIIACLSALSAACGSAGPSSPNSVVGTYEALQANGQSPPVFIRSWGAGGTCNETGTGAVLVLDQSGRFMLTYSFHEACTGGASSGTGDYSRTLTGLYSGSSNSLVFAPDGAKTNLGITGSVSGSTIALTGVLQNGLPVTVTGRRR